jgi:hypothetical protein
MVFSLSAACGGEGRGEGGAFKLCLQRVSERRKVEHLSKKSVSFPDSLPFDQMRLSWIGYFGIAGADPHSREATEDRRAPTAARRKGPLLRSGSKKTGITTGIMVPFNTSGETADIVVPMITICHLHPVRVGPQQSKPAGPKREQTEKSQINRA